MRDPGENPLRPHLRAHHDLGLALAFEGLHETDLAWSEERAIWRQRVDGIWLEDQERAGHEAVRDFLRLLELFILELPTDHEDRVGWSRALMRHQMGDTSNILSKAKTGLQRAEGLYDADPFELNVKE